MFNKRTVHRSVHKRTTKVEGYFMYLSECCVRMRAEDLASRNSVCTAEMCCGEMREAPSARAASAPGVSSCAAYLRDGHTHRSLSIGLTHNN